MAAYFIDSIVVYQRAGYLFDPKEGGIGLTKLDVSLANGYNNNFTAACTDPVTDALYFVYSPDTLASWNTASSKLQYDYTTKTFLTPYPNNFECAQVRGPSVAGSTTFQLISDGTAVYTGTPSSQGEFVVSQPTRSGREWKMRLYGTDPVEVIEAADDMEELS